MVHCPGQTMVLSCIAFVFLAATSQASGASTLACISSSRSSCSSDFHILSSSLRLRGGSAAAAPTNPAAAASAAPAVPPPPPRDPQAELLQAAYDGDVVLAEEVIELGADPNKVSLPSSRRTRRAIFCSDTYRTASYVTLARTCCTPTLCTSQPSRYPPLPCFAKLAPE